MGDTPYHEPLWRFVRVLASPPGASLTIQQSKEVGRLFEQLSEQYEAERRVGLERIAVELGGSLRPYYATDDAPTLTRLDRMSVAFRFVPIVAFPRRWLVIDDLEWSIRETVTVCAEASRSKIWQHASLRRIAGRSVLEHSVTLEEIGRAERTFESFRRRAHDELQSFYARVISQDVEQSIGIKLPEMAKLDCVKTAAILGLMTQANLDQALDRMQRQGVGATYRDLREGRADELPEAVRASVRDFLDWISYRGTERSTVIDAPKHPESFRSSRGLVVRQSDPDDPKALRIFALCRYEDVEREVRTAGLDASSGEHLEMNAVKTSRVVITHLAEEFGRYF